MSGGVELSSLLAMLDINTAQQDSESSKETVQTANPTTYLSPSDSEQNPLCWNTTSTGFVPNQEMYYIPVHTALSRNYSLPLPPGSNTYGMGVNSPVPNRPRLDRCISEPLPLASVLLGVTGISCGDEVGQLSLKAAANLCRYKSELCRPYEEHGQCKYGDKCQFAHGRHELRSMIRHPKYKTDLCKTYHTTGLCPYGPRCHFIHNDDERLLSESNQQLIEQHRARIAQLQQRHRQQLELSIQIKELQRRMTESAASGGAVTQQQQQQLSPVHLQQLLQAQASQERVDFSYLPQTHLRDPYPPYNHDVRLKLLQDGANVTDNNPRAFPDGAQCSKQGLRSQDYLGSTADSSPTSLTDASPCLSPIGVLSVDGDDSGPPPSVGFSPRESFNPTEPATYHPTVSQSYCNPGPSYDRSSCSAEVIRNRAALALLARKLQTNQLSPVEVQGLLSRFLYPSNAISGVEDGGLPNWQASLLGDGRIQGTSAGHCWSIY